MSEILALDTVLELFFADKGELPLVSLEAPIPPRRLRRVLSSLGEAPDGGLLVLTFSSKAPRWTPWRELLKRSFGVDGWACPYCDQRMRLRAVVLPPATHKALRGLQAACAACRAPPGADAMAG